MNKHLIAILRGVVTKSNVIGIRKALNAADRRSRGHSVGVTAPKLTLGECDEIEAALRVHEPRVKGELHDTGLARLRNKRYRKRLAGVADIIANLTHFNLVGFDEGTPIYRACARTETNSFLFMNRPWQRNLGTHERRADGPELVT